MSLAEQIQAKSRLQGEITILPVVAELEIAQKGGYSQHEVQKQALAAGVLPARYLRNFGTVGLDGQRTLFVACVAVVGVGGLGGWAVELLARMGIGHLLVIDGDKIAAHNLNRQLLATQNNLGEAKVVAAKERVAAINGGVKVDIHQLWLSAGNAKELLAPAQVVVDALDNIPGRFLLQDTIRELNIPLVHGAIGGYQGQVMTIFPADPGLDLIYPAGRASGDKGAEVQLGNPAATPAMVAAWQVQEVVKIILGQGELLRNRLLFFDAYSGRAEVFTVG